MEYRDLLAYLNGEIWNYENGDDSVTLDGYFTIDQLETLVKYMKEHKENGK